MKTVIALIGSLRKNSYNRAVFEHYKDISKELFDLKEGPIAKLPLYSEDLTPPADVLNLAQQIKQSDGVIFFSPEYNYSIPGGLKNAIDWLSRSDLKPFNDKPSAIIGASPGNIGTARMQYHLRQVGVFLNLKILNKPEVMIGKCHEKISDGKVTDPSTTEHLKKHITAFNELLSQ